MPKLKSVAASLDEIDEAHREFYEEHKEGDKTTFVLSIDDDVRSHPKVGALHRGHERVKGENRTLKTKVQELEAKISDLPEEFTIEEWDRLRALDAGGEGGGDVRKQIDAAVAAARQQEQGKAERDRKRLETENSALKTDLEKEKKARRDTLIEQSLSTALTEAGITKPSFNKAARALLEKHLEVVDEDGNLVVRARSEFGGDDVARYVQTWSQSDDGKPFVDPPKGGGAEGDRGPGGGGPRGDSSNPFLKSSWNITQQGLLRQSDPVKADRLAKVAGHNDALSARIASAK